MDTGADGRGLSDLPDLDTELDTEADAEEDLVPDIATEPDIDADVEPDIDADAREEDTGVSPDAIPDYLRCETRTDCPIGGGDCVMEVQVNRAGASVGDTVTVAEAFGVPDLIGVCSRDCTSQGQVACDTLTIDDSRGRPAAFTCQLVWAGPSAYETAQAEFPFDEALNEDEMEAGVHFAALCRPPMEIHADVSDRFCEACASDSDCGDGICFDARSGSGGGPGLCVTACADDTCPLGFACEDVDGSASCVPSHGTCVACSDLDSDGFGVGRCADGSEPVTAVDCDDRDGNVWYDPIDAGDDEHSFPDFCGAIDYNCNGIADDVEQVGVESWNSAHCTACGDVCEGAIEDGNATRGCRFRVDSMACVAICDSEGVADCDGDIENGCETVVTDPSRLYYRDADEDGRGDSSDVLFDCGDSGAPDGYVAIGGDCLDDPAAPGAAITYGSFERDGTDYEAAAEICDGVDNNCLGDGDFDAIDAGTACAGSDAGVCAKACVDGALTCAPASGDGIEICDGLDNDCDGSVDDDDDSFDGEGDFGEACTVPGALGPCEAGFWVCGAGEGLVCQSSHTTGADRPDLDQVDNDCDGLDGDYDDAVFVRRGGTDIDLTCRFFLSTCAGAFIEMYCPTGLEDDALSDIQDAVNLASCLDKDVYVTAGFYSIDDEIRLADNVGIYGGYTWTSDDGWARGTDRTEIERDGGTDDDPIISVFVGQNLNATTREVELHSLDLETVDAPHGSGQHNIVFLCDGCSGVVLADLTIDAGDGGDGREEDDPASNGVSGANAIDGFASGASSSCSGMNVSGGTGGSSNVDNGSGGNGPSGGARGPNELNLCHRGGFLALSDCGEDDSDSYDRGDHDGGGGGGGGNASAASVSNVAPIFPTWESDEAISSAAGHSGLRGGPGSGGGGGGHSCYDFIFGSDSANGGGGGSGGCGGSGGTGGGQGGHSIALHLTDSTGFLLARNVDLIRGDAGAGGAGQPGGQGGIGGQGADGEVDIDLVYSVVSLIGVTPFCGWEVGEGSGGGGGGGGAGAGGNGGDGGPGGSSFALVRDNTNISVDSDTAYDTWYDEIGMPATGAGGLGQGGLGGAGGPARIHTSSTDPGDGGSGYDGMSNSAGDSGEDGGSGVAGNNGAGGCDGLTGDDATPDDFESAECELRPGG